MTDQNGTYPGPGAQNAPRFVAQASAASTPTVAPQQGMGPYTLREWIVIGAAALLLILSFFSRAQASTFIGYAPIWTLGIAWLPAVVLPLLAAALIAVRRANSVRNFGSLSIDQLASVTFVGASVTWLHVAVTLGSLSSWVTWVALVVSLAGVFFTVFARFVAPFSDDFTGREEVPAHPAARPARPVVQAPRPAAPAATPYGTPQENPFAAPAQQQADPFQTPAFQAPAAGAGYQAAAPETGSYDRFEPSAAQVAAEQGEDDPSTASEAPGASEPASADAISDVPVTGAEEAAQDEAAADEPEPATQVVTAVAAEELAASESDETAAPVDETVAQPAPATQSTPVGQQPFWALVPEERDVHDFEGRAIYKIGPTAWALVLEDRGTYFVMRHDDGRIGYLHNIQGVTRG